MKELLEHSGLAADQIYAVELIGGATRVPKLQAKLQEFLGRKELDRHLDTDEAIVIAAATVAAATAGWTAHGLHPLCTLLPTIYFYLSSCFSNYPEDSETFQAQHLAYKSPVVSSYESEESGDAKLNTSSKVTINLDINRPISENLNLNQTEDRKLVDLSSCGSNTTSGSEETDALEKKKNRSREITSL
ncbi:unnamed protein product [Vicia faba]|uniref:Uncharacterized protein n=1 Tax=Vicia faba TaxID=3906 RepID=A0AAV1A8G8_VICFA|nr:unnamed protein product [Vicia faba]